MVNQNKGGLQGKRDLFGRTESNQVPSNLQIIQFNSASQQWELVSAVVGQAVQTSSNVGSGEGVAKPRVGDDLPFRTLVQNAEILLTGSTDEIAFSVGIIAQSKIANLVNDLLAKENKSEKGVANGYAGLDGSGLLFLANIPALPISQITGLQTALDSKIDTVANVGTGIGKIFRDKIGTTANLKSIKAGTNVSIVNNADDIEISSIDTGEINNATNVGAGAGVFKQKTGVVLEFKSLLQNAEILIANNVSDLAFSIGAIAQSKITGLVTALASKLETLTNVGTGEGIAKAKVGVNNDLKSLLANTEILIANNVNDLAFSIGAIAQSKITGLVTALASKLETLTNVGVGTGKIAKAKVGVNNDIKSILAGAGITVNNLTDEIQIVNNNPTPPDIPPSFIMNSNNTEIANAGTDYWNLSGIHLESSVEVDRQNAFPNACILRRMTLSLTQNTDEINTWTLRKNGANGNQVISIPASTTGTFQDLVNSDSIANGDLVNYQSINAGAGNFEVQSNGVEVIKA